MVDSNVSPAAEKKSRFFYGYNIVILAFIIMILTYGVRTSFGVFFKPIESEFDWSRALISGAVTLSTLVQGLWGIYMGRVNDKIGSRWVITICSFFMGLGLIMVSTTRYSWQLYVFYGLIVGVGMGGVFVALISTVARWFVQKRGLMTGIVMAGIGLGTLTFAPISNWLISFYGWRVSNIIFGVLVLVVGIVTAQFLRRDPAIMGLLPYGQTEGKQAGTHSAVRGLTLKESASTWQFWVVAIIFASVGYCTFTITIHIVPHITDLGISAAIAAAILGVTGGVQSIGGIVFGMAADRIGSRRVIIICLVLVSAALFWLVPITTVLMFYLFAIVYSLGIGGATVLGSTLSAEYFGMKSHGVILGFISFGFTIGASIGPVITGYLFDITGNYKIAFILCAAIGIIGILMALILRPIKKLESSI